MSREKLEEVIEPFENQKEPKKRTSLGGPIKLKNKITSPSLNSCEQKTEKNKIENYEYKLFKKLGKIPPFSLHGVNFIMNARFKKAHDEFELRGVHFNLKITTKLKTTQIIFLPNFKNL